jgi:TonB family protein
MSLGPASRSIAMSLLLLACAARADTPATATGDTAAQLLTHPVPDYPTDMANTFMSGKVVIACRINTAGKPEAPKVLFASHPAFVPPSVRALFKAKFAPATHNGIPVSAPFEFLCKFADNEYGSPTTYGPAFSPPDRSPPSTPEQFKYDVAPRIVLMCEPVYPRELLLAGKNGAADIIFVIDPNGCVVAAKIAAATDPAFGEALQSAAETWRFTPAKRDGKRVSTLLSQHHEFRCDIRELDNGYIAAEVLSAIRKHEAMATPQSLDSPLHLLYTVEPEYPHSEFKAGTRGEAVVEFVVDRGGSVRFPRVVTATAPVFGRAAMTAVQQWYYEIPVLKTKPVNVLNRVSFGFAPAKPVIISTP